jgi:hypothetical protein
MDCPRRATSCERAVAGGSEGRVLRRTILAGCAAVVGMASSIAEPASGADAPPAEAASLFAQGRALRLHGDCANALTLFRRAYALYPAGLGSLRNAAECEAELGHLAAARRSWLDLQRSLLTSEDSKYEGWGQDAAQAAAQLGPRLVRLTIEVRALGATGQPAAVNDIQVLLNGERLDRNFIDKPLELDPGHYVVVPVDAGGRPVAQERALDLAPGEDTRIELRAVVPSPSDHVTARPSPSRAAPPVATWIAAGVGAASFLGAGIAELERQAALRDRRALLGQCPAGSAIVTCDAHEVQSINDRGNTAATWVNVLLTAGAVSVAGGIVLYAIHWRPRRTALVVSPSAFAVSGEF